MRVIILAVLIAMALIVGSVALVKFKAPPAGEVPADNVQMVAGEQIITIRAKGGYWPRVINAQAGVPTVIKVVTAGTFDCSAALVIPSLNYRKNLPPSGETIIAVPPQASGTVLRGLCAMGMYSFVIQFD